MAAMRPLKTLTLLGFSPILQGHACRAPSPVLVQQCFSYSTSTPPASFVYRIAASFSAKGKRFDPKKDCLAFNESTSNLPDLLARKRPASGQDAFFFSNIGNSTNVAFGVADGVGGWSDSGIDPAHFSHGLCEHMASIALGVEKGSEGKLRARDLLQWGYDAVVDDDAVVGGGSTACIAVGGSNGALQVANLGDSGFVQLRPNRIYYTSDPQTHAFNTPFQLSIIPPKILRRSIAFGGHILQDNPVDASVTNHTVKHGDVLVFATDGVWDNLNSTDVLKLVSRLMTRHNGWQAGEDGYEVSSQLESLTREDGISEKQQENSLQAMLAIAIAADAKAASVNPKVDGPFAREVQKFYPRENWHGGKVDDICVVVAIVVEAD